LLSSLPYVSQLPKHYGRSGNFDEAIQPESGERDRASGDRRNGENKYTSDIPHERYYFELASAPQKSIRLGTRLVAH
jgi:hypothetical protein